MKIDNEDFGTLAVCAIRYCQGRETYMPELVRGIVRGHISEVTDKDLQVMINDCEYQYAFGDENIDKPRWIEWKEFLITEQKKRKADIQKSCNTCKHKEGCPKLAVCQGCRGFSHYERGSTEE